jgi:hypothetical protein
MMEESEVARLRVLFALQRLPPSLLSAIVGDWEVPMGLGIQPTRLPLSFGEGKSVAHDAFLNALEAAAEGPVALTLRDNGENSEATARLAEDGSALIESADLHVRVAHASLWHPNIARRVYMLDTILRGLTLDPASITDVRTLISSSTYSEEIFTQATDILNTAPEEFANRLASKLSEGGFGEANLLPEEARHWQNLAPVPHDAASWSAYMAKELTAARTAALGYDTGRWFWALSLQFSSPELVPLDLLATLDAEAVLRYLDGARVYGDPYTVVGAFEICRRRFGTDARFVAAGSTLLATLFDDRDRLMHRCAAFAAAFVLATVRLALHEATRAHPVYWRRLVASAHASLVVRVFGDPGLAADRLHEWAMSQRGEQFLLSVYSEMDLSPRWQPEWIEPDFLTADIFGRIQGACLSIPAAEMPPSWGAYLASARRTLLDEGSSLRIFLPSVTQGERLVDRALVPQELEATLRELQEELENSATPANFVRYANLTELSGVPADVAGALCISLERILSSIDHDKIGIWAVLDTATRMAALSHNPRLAELAADALLQTAEQCTDSIDVLHALLRLLECSAAEADIDQARRVLARRLERLVVVIPQGDIATRLHTALRSLQNVSVILAPVTARAVHGAKLASARRLVSMAQPHAS